MMKTALIEAPICKGSPTDGSQFAYRVLTQFGLASRFADAVLCPMAPPDPVGEECPTMKYVSEVMEVSRKLCETVGGILREGGFPVVIGGDHSAAIGSIAGASSVWGADRLAVIYIDGHTDINTEVTTETGFIHGMSLAAAMGLCDPRLTAGRRVNLLGRNTVILGARSIDPGEYPIITAQQVTLITAEEIRKRGMKETIREVLGRLTVPAIHISFDVDFLDETAFSSTGYRMPDGLTPDDAAEALRACFDDGRVCSLDCVEYNPLMDETGADREKLFRLLDLAAAYTDAYTPHASRPVPD